LIPVDIIEGFEPKKTATPARSNRKPGNWRPGEGRGNSGNGGNGGNGGKPGQRSFAKPGSAPRKEGGGFGGNKGGRFSDSPRRSYGDR